MKTTIEVSDTIFFSAKQLAQQSKTTLRALIEEGLRRVLKDAQSVSTQPTFTLRDARVRGEAPLMPDPRDWQQLETQHITPISFLRQP